MINYTLCDDNGASSIELPIILHINTTFIYEGYNYIITEHLLDDNHIIAERL